MEGTIDALAKIFARFPGIGERQARRFVYHLLKEDKKSVDELVALISTLKKHVSQCSRCFRFFNTDGYEECAICKSPERNHSMLMVVEKDADLESVERSGTYKGLYFVLGGLIPIVGKETLKLVRVDKLKERIQDSQKKDILKEIILAFSLNPQGDHTDLYIRQLITSSSKDTNLKISSLGRGLSTGTELEYSDKETLKNALKNRQ